jgi:glutathione S-transferase
MLSARATPNATGKNNSPRRAAARTSAPAHLSGLTDKPILYSFRRCPYAMRARMALLVAGTACHIREVKLSSKPAELIAASPKGTVPVVVRTDGVVIEESLEIMRWALGQNDPEQWLAREDRGFIEANDGPFKHHLDRYKYPERHGSDPAEHRTAGLNFLQLLDHRLAVQRNLCGAERGITDVAIFPFVRQFAATDRSWFDRQAVPDLRAWLGRHLASDLFSVAMIRLEPWQPGDRPREIPA